MTKLRQFGKLGDPRHYQIAVLTSLLSYGILWLDLEVRAAQAIGILITAQLTQYVCTRLFGLPRFDPKSALISSLSLMSASENQLPGRGARRSQHHDCQ